LIYKNLKHTSLKQNSFVKTVIGPSEHEELLGSSWSLVLTSFVQLPHYLKCGHHSEFLCWKPATVWVQAIVSVLVLHQIFITFPR